MNIIKPFLIIFNHKIFKKNEKFEENCSNKICELIYKYPIKSDQQFTENLMNIIIASFTLSIDKNNFGLKLISLKENKIIIDYYKIFEEELLFFIFICKSEYNDEILLKNLEYLKTGLFFILGEKGFKSNIILNDFLRSEGNRILKKYLPYYNKDLFSYSFFTIPFIDFQSSTLLISLTELYLLKNDLRIWSIVCFYDNSILISQTPLEIVRLILFSSPESPQTKIYLTSKQRELILLNSNTNPNIPNEEIIEGTLLRFEKDKMVYYIITVPQVVEDLLLNILNIINKSMLNINIINSKHTVPYSFGTLMYDKEMMFLREGELNSNAQDLSIKIHSIFIKENDIKEILIKNPSELIVGTNFYGVENYSYINESKFGLIEQIYDEAINKSPQILRFKNG